MVDDLAVGAREGLEEAGSFLQQGDEIALSELTRFRLGVAARETFCIFHQCVFFRRRTMPPPLGAPRDGPPCAFVVAVCGDGSVSLSEKRCLRSIFP